VGPGLSDKDFFIDIEAMELESEDFVIARQSPLPHEKKKDYVFLRAYDAFLEEASGEFEEDTEAELLSLQKELEKAKEEENFERAAVLRDEIARKTTDQTKKK
jgi:excinuclease UvrABC helicase subunit UvrB